MLYLDTFGRNSSIYISETFQKDIFEDDSKINGQFYKIKPNETYLIKIRLYSNISISNIKKYFYPLNWDNIIIKNDEINFLYLLNEKEYTHDFSQNTMNKMIKLSSKITNSTITIKINEEQKAVLNKESPYFEIKNEFKDKLTLVVSNNDVFIEFLSNTENIEILDNTTLKDHQIKNNIEVINIPRTQKFFSLGIKSNNNNLVFSLAIGLSNNKNYYY